jgi:hypothetical protein
MAFWLEKGIANNPVAPTSETLGTLITASGYLARAGSSTSSGTRPEPKSHFSTIFLQLRAFARI